MFPVCGAQCAPLSPQFLHSCPGLSHEWKVSGPGGSLVVGCSRGPRVRVRPQFCRSTAMPSCPRLPHVLAYDPPASRLTSCVAADAPTGHELGEGCLPCGADPLCAASLVLHTAEEGAAGLGCPCQGPWSLWPVSVLLRLSALRACMAWVPANSKPRRAVTGQECRPGTHRGAWRQGPSQCCASETSCQSDGSSSPALRPHLGLGVSQSSPSRETASPSAWPPRKRPLQPVTETLSRSLVWLVGCRVQRGCPPFPHPALARALGRPVPQPRSPGEPVCCSAVGRSSRK